jgi:hypothetical protein
LHYGEKRYHNFDFINAYYENIGRQNIEAIEAHPLGQAIAKFCDEEFGNDDDDKEAEEQQNKQNKTEWEDTASEHNFKVYYLP